MVTTQSALGSAPAGQPTSKPIHGQPTPYYQQHESLSEFPPVECDLRVGDVVTFTNDAGLKFPGHHITAFAKKLTSWGACVYLDGDSPWFPVKVSSLTKA